MLRFWAQDALLWYNVISLSIWFGGTVYQMLVIVPLWSADPPETVRSFFTVTDYPRSISNFFGRKTQAFRAIPLFLLTVTGWFDPRMRFWLALPSVCMIAALAMTFRYIYPMNEILIFKAGGNLTAEESRAMVHRWIVADRVRLAIMSVGFLSLLYAFRTA